MVNKSWNQDPKRTLFTLARYKFVARMLAGRKHVLEVGCADAFGTRIVQQAVGKVTATDFDPSVRSRRQRADGSALADRGLRPRHVERPGTWKVRCRLRLDVLEHIQEKDEDTFIRNTIASLTPEGIVIFGMPSLESQTPCVAAKQGRTCELQVRRCAEAHA